MTDSTRVHRADPAGLADDAGPLVAQVAVDVPLPHLDRPFDYLVPEAMVDTIKVGVRVRVQFAGQRLNGFVVGLERASTQLSKLRPVERVISEEVVLTAAIAKLCRAVADHWGGTFADVVRLAVPPRHAGTEKAEPPVYPQPTAQIEPTLLPHYPHGTDWLAKIAEGQPVRAAWAPVPVIGTWGDWVQGLVEAAAVTLNSGRGVLLLVPDADALNQLREALTVAFGRRSFVTLSAEAGPAARYRSFLAISRGQVSIVAGTRAAVFAPINNLGLIAMWDDGNDSYVEPRAPYWHARDVAALRATHERCALLVAGFARTAEVQAWSERRWLVPLDMSAQQNRQLGPVVRVTADSDIALERDPYAKAVRLPRDAFATIRTGLASGPVLIQVPRAGYVSALSCQDCRSPAVCARCGQRLRGERGENGVVPWCAWCGAVPGWHCAHCSSIRLRAPSIGVTRTAEELGRAFPGVAVYQSWSGHLIRQVGEGPALVLATPGAEPRATTGYAAALLLDTGLLLNRVELRAAEEALRRWLSAVALVRPASDGGTVMAVGDSESRALQALIRLDPAGFASRELADRMEAGFPPARRMVVVEGDHEAMSDYSAAVLSLPDVEVFGPYAVDDQTWRLTARAICQPQTLIDAVRAVSGQRSARKRPGSVRVQVDPYVIA